MKITSDDMLLIYSLMWHICSSDHPRSSSIEQRSHTSRSHYGIKKQSHLHFQIEQRLRLESEREIGKLNHKIIELIS